MTRYAKLSFLLTIIFLGFFAIIHPVKVNAKDMNDSTGTVLMGSYTLTEDLSGKSYTLGGDTEINLNGHIFEDGGKKNLTLFDVPKERKLIITGDGSFGIQGHDIAFKLAEGSTLELRNTRVFETRLHSIYAEGNDITVNLDGTIISYAGKYINDSIFEYYKDGTIYVKGNNFTLHGENGAKISNSYDEYQYGGGLYAEGSNVSVSGITFSDLKAEKSGGGVWVTGFGCTVENCSFIKDTAEMRGGGLYISGGNATVQDCKFEGNHAYFRDVVSSIFLSGAVLANKIIDEFGAIFDTDINQVDGRDNIFYLFVGLRSNNLFGGDSGAGLYINGDRATVSNITAHKNECKLHGGGVCINGNKACVKDSVIGDNWSMDNGGGISLIGDENSVINVELNNNCCVTDGGGIEIKGNDTVITNLQANACLAAEDGGGALIEGNNCTVTDSDFSNCRAVDDGGSIYVNGKNCLIDNSNFSECMTYSDKGGAIYFYGSDHTAKNCTLFANIAKIDYGGAIFVDAENVTVDGCDFRENMAGYSKKYGSLDDTVPNADLYSGGAVYSDRVYTQIKGSTFSMNCGKDGGSVYFNRENATLQECTFKNNYAQRDGGAVYFDDDVTTTDSCIFEGNRAFNLGGAVYYDGENNKLTGYSGDGVLVENNRADEEKNYGHGVFVDDTDLTLGGKLIIRNNSNVEISKVKEITDDEIPTWSNLCLYDDTELTIADEGIQGSEIWVDSDWGHYKKPAGGYVYKSKNSPDIKVSGFKSDRSGFHFVGKKGTLYYEEGTEKVLAATLPPVTVSVRPMDDKWRKNPGRVYIDFDCPYDSSVITKNFSVTKTVNNGARETVQIKNADGRDYVDVTGEKGDTVDYRFVLSYSVTVQSPAGGTETCTSKEVTARYCVENLLLSSRVSLLSAYESFGELVAEDLGRASEGSVFEYSGMRYPVLNKGQLINGWKLHVDGESKDRDITVIWDEKANSIKCTLPGDLDGRDIMLIPQRQAKKCKVEYDTEGTLYYRGLNLPNDETVDYGTKITINPVGSETGNHSIGSIVNGKATWGREPYTIEVTKRTYVDYVIDDRTSVTVRFDDERMKTVVGEEKNFKPGQSFLEAGFKSSDSRYGMDEIDHFQIMHGDGIYDKSLTLGLNDPILDDYTLKPIWKQTVKVQVSSRSNEGILAKEMTLAGGERNGERIDADIKTGGKVKVSYKAPEGRYLTGWMVSYYSWRSAMSPGVTELVASDTVTSDGQKIAAAVNKNGEAVYTYTEKGLEFTVNEDMKAIKEDTPLRIYISPIFTEMVKEISGIPGEMQIGDILNLNSVTITPSKAAKPSDIKWTVHDVNGEREVSGTFSPSVTGPVTLRATIANGLGIGKDYVQTFMIEASTVNLVFYDDMAGTKEGKTFQVEAGMPLTDYAETLPGTVPEDYSFAGWTDKPKKDGSYSYKETIGEESILFDFTKEMPAETFALYPVFIRDRLKVELDLGDGGNEYTPAEFGIRPDGEEQSGVFYADINEALQTEALNSATRPGYELAGWYTSNGVKITDDWPITPKHCEVDENADPIIDRINNFNFYTVRLTAMWTPVEIKVTCFDNIDGPGNGEELYSDTISLGHILVLPGAAQAAPGQEFDCWTDIAGRRYAAGEEVLFDDSMWALAAADGSLSFTAEYTDAPAEDVSTIRFNTEGGSYVEKITAVPGEEITGPEDPERAGYRFTGWVLDGQGYEFPALMPEEAIELTATWAPKNYTIRFYSRGGTGIQSITAKYGTDISGMKPADPVKDYFTFAGWTPEYPETMPAADMTLYALWIPNTYSVAYDANGGLFEDGTDLFIYQGGYDAPVVYNAPVPVKPGYTFDGWDSDTSIHIPGVDMAINAQWKEEGKEPAPSPAPTPAPEKPTEAKTGSVHKVGSGTYKILSAKNKTVILLKAKDAKAGIKVPAKVKIGGKTYKVKTIASNAFKGCKAKKVTIGANVSKIQRGAFKGSKVTTLIVKTKKLKKANVKGSLKGSKVKTIKIKIGKKKTNKKYVRKYKKIFTKKNAGRKVNIK